MDKNRVAGLREVRNKTTTSSTVTRNQLYFSLSIYLLNEQYFSQCFHPSRSPWFSCCVTWTQVEESWFVAFLLPLSVITYYLCEGGSLSRRTWIDKCHWPPSTSSTSLDFIVQILPLGPRVLGFTSCCPFATAGTRRWNNFYFRQNLLQLVGIGGSGRQTQTTVSFGLLVGRF